MRSRLVAMRRGSSLFFPLFRRRICNCASNGAGDPAIHSEAPQMEAYEASKAATAQKFNPFKRTQTDQPYSPTSNITHIPSPPKLENPTITLPSEPFLQLKRCNHTAPTRAIEEASCVGLDGTPVDDQLWRGDEKDDDDYRAYYKEHRPSPISGFKIADTRKPIRKATDGGVEEAQYGGGEEVKGWLPEQLDTAEEALLRAEAMFWAAKERGDPDSPHGRALKRLLAVEF